MRATRSRARRQQARVAQRAQRTPARSANAPPLRNTRYITRTATRARLRHAPRPPRARARCQPCCCCYAIRYAPPAYNIQHSYARALARQNTHRQRLYATPAGVFKSTVRYAAALDSTFMPRRLPLSRVRLLPARHACRAPRAIRRCRLCLLLSDNVAPRATPANALPPEFSSGEPPQRCAYAVDDIESAVCRRPLPLCCRRRAATKSRRRSRLRARALPLMSYGGASRHASARALRASFTLCARATKMRARRARASGVICARTRAAAHRHATLPRARHAAAETRYCCFCLFPRRCARACAARHAARRRAMPCLRDNERHAVILRNGVTARRRTKPDTLRAASNAFCRCVVREKGETRMDDDREIERET